MYWSENVYKMLGLCVSEHPALVETMLSVVHADDRRSVESLLRGAPDRRSPERVDFRVMLGTHPVRHCRLEARPVCGGGRSPVLSGICQDITRQKEAEKAKTELTKSASA